MSLDGGARALEGDRLNNIWVECSLKEELNLSSLWRIGRSRFDLQSFSLEDLDESVANELSLGLWVIGDALQPSKEYLRGIDNGKIDTKMLGEGLLDCLAFVKAHNTIVNEDSMEALANGLLHELSSNSRVDTSADGSKNLSLFSNQCANSGNLLINKLSHGPVLSGLADSDGEVFQELRAARSMCDFWVELDAVDWLRFVGNASEWRIGGSGNRVEVWWKRAELVAVGHPDLNIVLEALEQLIDVTIFTRSLQLGVPVLSVFASNDIFAVVPCDLLQTIAYAENWDSEVEHGWVDVRSVLLIHGVWTTGENDTLRLP